MFSPEGVSGGEIGLEQFEATIWRQKASPLGRIDISQLAELSFENFSTLAADEQVESRLIQRQADGLRLEFGPFDHIDLASRDLLMVQNADSLIPELSSWLSAEFGFLPRWRIEDVMATLANRGGNCGAHFDQYDVFLVQLTGKKHWQLDAGGHVADDLDAEAEIRLLKEFVPTAEFTMEPGDVLYVPPGVGHYGIASDDCITLSVGIRNPLLSEMAAHLADMLLHEATSETSLNDKLIGTTIPQAEVEGLSQKVVMAISDTNLISHWYGCYMTELRDPELMPVAELEMDLIEVEQWLRSQTRLELVLPARMAVQDNRLFLNGAYVEISGVPEWLLDLQQTRSIAASSVPSNDLTVVQLLLEACALTT